MSFILNIDTAVTGASVCVSQGLHILNLKQNDAPMESAAWIHTAIAQLLPEAGLAMKDISAVAVSAGPGSYTGLRVGMATAKGICFALDIPLITINTLHMMAAAALEEPTRLLCPMIDARRMEVFTGVYTKNFEDVMPAQALILQPDSFAALLAAEKITFFGNGSSKFQPLVTHQNAVFKPVTAHAGHLAALAGRAFAQQAFADLAYSEPFYGKAFFSPAHK